MYIYISIHIKIYLNIVYIDRRLPTDASRAQRQHAGVLSPDSLSVPCGPSMFAVLISAVHLLPWYQ